MTNKDSFPTTDYYQGSRPEIARLLPQKYTKVLEIGCGEGGFAANLEECVVWGIEPVLKVAELAQQKLDKVLIGTYESVYNELPDEFFDVVVCNDVIEHMVDPDSFFESIKSKLQPNGCLIGSIPNVRYVWNLYDLLIKKDWEYINCGILDRTHLKFFTEKSLKRIFVKHNFTIEEFYGINDALYCYHENPKKKKPLVKFILRAITVLSLYSYKDIRFLQFAFRVKY
jgi:2-polyprenyl-3-methyl-5-hydroxy-6-metoxy-1,4-benzoquinol methylase